jgi:hypothetical protein
MVLVVDAINLDHLELLAVRILLDSAVLHLEEADQVDHVLILLARFVALLAEVAELFGEGEVILRLLRRLCHPLVHIFHRLLRVTAASVHLGVQEVIITLFKVDLLHDLFFVVLEIVFVEEQAAVLDVEALLVVVPLLVGVVQGGLVGFIGELEMPLEKVQLLLILNV